jgi:sugar phosphate isomerase/epimerase
MMTLGTTGAFGFDDFPQPEVIGLYAAAGCSVLQVYRSRERTVRAADILSIANDLPLKIDSIHGHFGDDLDPSSEDESVRRATVETYRREADFCREVGGELVVVHPSPPSDKAGDLEVRYGQLRRTFVELIRIGEQAGVRFAFENMPPYHPVGHDVARLVREVASMNHPNIVFLLDTGHAHMSGGLPAAIHAAGKHIGYTHVHDNDGKNDTHLLPYRGTISWDGCVAGLHRAGYNGVFLLEVFENTADLRGLLTPEWRTKMSAILNGTHAPKPE